jgi:integrase
LKGPQMALTETAIRALKARDKPFKQADEKGLYLLITPSGGRLWKLKYRSQAGSEKKLSLGSYPDISLKDARVLRDVARAAIAKGGDPAANKRRDKQIARINAANTFAGVANAYIDKNRRDGLADATIRKREWLSGLVGHTLGPHPVADIEPIEVLEAIRPFEAAKNDEKAHRALQFVGQVMRFAVANQLAKSDPTRDLRGALNNRRPKHHAALLEPRKVGQLMRAIDGYDGMPVTRIALELSALLFVRPGELRHAEWSEIDCGNAVWKIPASKMKGRIEHAVPLPCRAIQLFEEARGSNGLGRYVFPSARTSARPMSENTVNSALRRLGYSGDEMTAHGFRALASTLLNESGKWSSDAIERALAHKDRDNVRAAYHRGAHWNERVEMAKWWAEYLDQLRADVENL